MDTYLPAKWRHRFASYADDITAGADTLEELFELLKALIECFDKAGVQVKARKLIFGVREISFHNYTISKDQTQHVHSKECDGAEDPGMISDILVRYPNMISYSLLILKLQ